MIPTDLDTCSALIYRSGNSHAFYSFSNPVEEIEGSNNEWELLEKKLALYQVSSCDCMHPPGAAVGYFTYEGDYHFRFYRTVELVPVDSIFVATQQLHGSANVQEPNWKSTHQLDNYCKMVEAALEAIRQGDIYQINLARKFEIEVEDWDPILFLKVLWHVTKAPYFGFLKFDDHELFAASPELFLSIQGNKITTQPIKGTRPRGVTAIDDRQNALELATNAKEVAELVMITDLERNDLGAISEYGSVEVKELVRCREYSHVFHLVSTIVSTLLPGLSPLEAVQACYPGGSITGAPKKKAMEFIKKLEGQDRGYYTGAFGYFGFDGSVQLGMSIRTCERRDQTLSFWAGSGITIESDPVKEFEETGHKAKAILDAYALYLKTKNAQVLTETFSP